MPLHSPQQHGGTTTTSPDTPTHKQDCIRPTTTPRNQTIACRSCDIHHGGRHPRAQQKRNTNITTCNLQGAGSEEGKRHLSDLDLKLSKTRERSTPACTNQSRVSPLLMIWVIISTTSLCNLTHHNDIPSMLPAIPHPSIYTTLPPTH